MFVWRKRASAVWLAANEVALREIAGQRLAIVSTPQVANAIAEIASWNFSELQKIRRQFGGVIEKLSRGWLQKFLRVNKSRPLRIGKRLLIASSGRSNSRSLIIPAGAAFGTGEHVTTAMPLRMLERLTRKSVARGAERGRRGRVRSPDEEFSLLDLGTGSGILALTAKRFGAGKVIAIDNDPIAIAAAKKNAQRNQIAAIQFRVADVRQWKFPAKIDIVTANLFSELLIEILPKLKCAEWLILSGVLRQQEPQLLRALKTNGVAILETRRRGKWVAILARRTIMSSRAQTRDVPDAG